MPGDPGCQMFIPSTVICAVVWFSPNVRLRWSSSSATGIGFNEPSEKDEGRGTRTRREGAEVDTPSDAARPGASIGVLALAPTVLVRVRDPSFWVAGRAADCRVVDLLSDDRTDGTRRAGPPRPHEDGPLDRALSIGAVGVAVVPWDDPTLARVGWWGSTAGCTTLTVGTPTGGNTPAAPVAPPGTTPAHTGGMPTPDASRTPHSSTRRP